MRAEPREEAARVDVEWRANVDGVGETRPLPREKAVRVDEERRADLDGVGERRS
jgi:hypothetical protein